MKKGLRLQIGASQIGVLRQTIFPDEEGIKTGGVFAHAVSRCGQTIFPDEEGIKTEEWNAVLQ